MRVSLSTIIAGSWLLVLASSGCIHKPELVPLDEALTAKPVETVTLEINAYQPAAGRIFRHLFVSNFSVKLSGGKLQYSASRDGLSDSTKTAQESLYGFRVGLPDSNANGFGDLLMYLAGITAPNQNTLYCGPAQRASSANDAFTYADARLSGNPMMFLGLRDCERSFLQLNPLLFDFDRDGIPDYLEIRAGLNPKNPADADLSVAGDKLTNLERVKRNIPVDEDSNSEPNRVYAYQYSTDFDLSGRRRFTVSNIPVLHNGLDNFIAVYLTETELSTQQDRLYSAYMILPVNSGGRTVRFDFWGADPNLSKTNQEIELR